MPPDAVLPPRPGAPRTLLSTPDSYVGRFCSAEYFNSELTNDAPEWAARATPGVSQRAYGAGEAL